MTWNRFFITNVLMKDRLYRQIHNRVIKLTPTRMSDILKRQRQGKLTSFDMQYVEATQTLRMREEYIRLNYLESCFNNSQDWTHA